MIKISNIKELYYYLVSSLLVFLYFSHGDNYLIIWNGIPSGFFFSIILLLILPLLFGKAFFRNIIHSQLLVYVVILLFVYFIWTVLSFVPGLNINTNYRYLYVSLLNIIILLLCAIFFSRPENIRVTLKILIFGVILGVGLNVYDILHIGNYYYMDEPLERESFSMVFARAAGFYLDPNVSAITLVLGLIVTEPLIKKKIYKITYVFIVGGAIAITLSLSGIFAYVVYVFLHFIYGKIKLKIILLVISSMIILGITFNYIIKNKIIKVGPGITNRILTITNPFGSENEVVKNNSRTILFKNAIKMITQDPVLGSGLGQHQFVRTEQRKEARSGTHAGPHNQWLAFMIDFGIVAGIILLALLFFVLKPKRNSIYKKEVYNFLIVLFIYSLFSHTIIKNHSLMFMLPLIYQMGRIKVKSNEN